MTTKNVNCGSCGKECAPSCEACWYCNSLLADILPVERKIARKYDLYHDYVDYIDYIVRDIKFYGDKMPIDVEVKSNETIYVWILRIREKFIHEKRIWLTISAIKKIAKIVMNDDQFFMFRHVVRNIKNLPYKRVKND